MRSKPLYFLLSATGLSVSLSFATSATAATCQQTLEQVKAGNFKVNSVVKIENAHKSIVIQQTQRILSGDKSKLVCTSRPDCDNHEGFSIPSPIIAVNELQTYTSGFWITVCPDHDPAEKAFRGTIVNAQNVFAPQAWFAMRANDLGIFAFRSTISDITVQAFPLFDHYPGKVEMPSEWGSGMLHGDSDPVTVSERNAMISIGPG